jgi:hypothetical protein
LRLALEEKPLPLPRASLLIPSDASIEKTSAVSWSVPSFCGGQAGRIPSAISRLLQLRRLISRMFWCAAVV